MNTHRIMTSAWALMVMLALSLSPVSGAPRGEQRVAVVELEDNARLGSGVANALTDSVRGEVAELLGRRFTMITKENIYELVDEQTCNDASGASCEVEMGKLLGAHYIISGALTKLGGKLNLALRVYETKTSKLLGVREESASDVGRLKERVLPRLARGASSLIDPSVASREDSFNEGLEALTSDIGDSRRSSQGNLNDALKRLEATELEDRELVQDGSDAEYQRELKRLEREQAAREAHERKAKLEFKRVEKMAQQSAKKGEVAVRLFMKEYGGHRLGNPMAVEAQSLLEQVQARQTEERRARLSEAHLKVVSKTWRKAKKFVMKGDDKAEQALALFLKTYADHPMGNPLESEAREAFAEAQRARQAKLEATHLKRVTGDWKKAQRVVKKGGKPAIKAVELFLKRFKDHPLGNPLESEAEGVLVSLIRRTQKTSFSVKIGIPSVGNFCKRTDITRVVSSRKKEFTYCYEKELVMNPNLSGEVTLAWILSLDGTVKKAWVMSSTLKNGKVESCMTRTLNSTRFARPDGGMCQIRLPFIFD